MVGLAVPLIREKVPSNSWFGLRIEATIDNPDVWYLANAFVGCLLFIYGLITILASILLAQIKNISDDAYAILISVYMVVGIIAIGVFGIRYAKELTRRTM
jgi:uncharacterized membrane protein